jgi:hypothetical protein
MINKNIWNEQDHRAHPKMFTIQISEVESHLTVTVPST